jgi:hypothetical protein
MKRTHLAHIERVYRPDPDAFIRDYLRPGRPVILTGIASEWLAAMWTPAKLEERFGGVKIRYETWDGDESVNDPFEFARRQRYFEATLSEYYRKLDQLDGPSRRLYSAGLPIARVIPEARRELGSLEAYMDLPGPAGLRRRLQVDPLLWLGPAGTVSTLHFDRWHNFFVQLYGRKKWIVLSQAQAEQVHWPCEELGLDLLHWSPVDVEHPDLARYPRFARAEPIELIVEPGEILFMPVGWWHHVRALDASISVNFWWAKPLDTMRSLRRYFYHYARLAALRSLGVGRAPAGGA